MGRADAEAEKGSEACLSAFEERRASKRAPATPLDELEESVMDAEAEKAVEAMTVAADAVRLMT